MPRRPLLWCAAAFAAGILAPIPEVSARSWAELAGALTGGALLLSLAARTIDALRIAAWLAAAGYLCTGQLAVEAASGSLPGEIDWLVAQHPALFSHGVQIDGAVARVPQRSAGRAPGEEWIVELESVRLLGRSLPARGAVRLWVPVEKGYPRHRARRGDALSTFARLHAPRRHANPGAFDYPRYLLARGVRAVGTVKSGRLHKVAAREEVTAACRLLRRADELRARMLIRIHGAFASTPSGRRAAAVSAALLVGERRGISREDSALLQDAGLSHLLAVSGFNVAILAGLVVLLLRSLRARGRCSAILAIPVLVLYLAINQEESSVARAVVMAVALLAGRLVGRRADPLNTLGLAALAILVTSPLQAHDPGFQLTFAATLPLVLMARARIAGGSRGARRGPAGYTLALLRASVAVSIAAVVVTQPLTALHFNRVTPGAVAANLLAAPMMAVAFTGALALEAIPAQLEAASAAASTVIVWMVEGTFAVAAAVSSAPWLTYRRPTPGPLLVSVYYVGLGILALARGPGAGRAAWRRATLVLWAPALVALAAPMDTRQPPAGLTLTALDVGQGDAMLIEVPGGPRLLVDAGGSALGEFDVGERVVSPALWRLGIATVDLVVVTHLDADHSGGAPSVARNFLPTQIWVPSGSISGGAHLRDLRSWAVEAGAGWHEAARGESVSWREMSLSVLHPKPGRDVAASDNERSLVLKVGWKGRAALLAGDAGVEVESEMSGIGRCADVLKVGHHGSRTSTSQGFLAAVRPRVAVISCGRDNRFGHPHQEVLNRLARAGALTCRTDRHGAVTVELFRDGTRVSQGCAIGGEESPFGVKQR